MYLYFFDLDDTICNTKEIALEFLKKHNLPDIKDLNSEENKQLELYFEKEGANKIKILNNSTVAILKDLITTNKEDVYYITARKTNFRQKSIDWLKKYDIYLGEEKLIMDTEGIKGQVINDIMLKNPNKKFAFFFDDLEDNHLEASKYNNIISCLPY